MHKSAATTGEDENQVPYRGSTASVISPAAAKEKANCRYSASLDSRGIASSRLNGYIQFVTELRRSKSKWAVAATDFFVAYLLTGVRSDEWIDVRRLEVGDKPALWVLFAADIGSLCPVRRRTIMLDEYDSEVVAVIDRHLERVQCCSTEAEFRVLFTSCRRLIRRVAYRIVPAAYQYPSLDGFRSIYSKKERIAIARAALVEAETTAA